VVKENEMKISGNHRTHLTKCGSVHSPTPWTTTPCCNFSRVQKSGNLTCLFCSFWGGFRKLVLDLGRRGSTQALLRRV